METLLVWGLGLIAVAFLLLVIDIFLPSAGLLLFVALSIAIAGVVCLYNHSVTWGIIGTLLVLVGSPSLFFIGLQVMPHTPIGRKLIPPDALDLEPSGPPTPSPLAKLVGQEADVVSDLRPIGVIRIGDQRLDALSETNLIRAGTRVRIVAVEGTEVRVRAV